MLRGLLMAKNYWMVVLSPENFEITKERGFKLHGMKSRYRRRAQRMEPDDRVLIYVSEWRKWLATARITSKYFQDRSPVWKSSNGKNEDYPYRVNMRPDIVLKERDFIDAMELAPRLEYIKRWPPEIWPLAFMDSLHLIPQRDYRLVEGEMKRIVNRGRKRRRRREQRDGDRPEQGRDGEEPTGEAEALQEAESAHDDAPESVTDEVAVPSHESEAVSQDDDHPNATEGDVTQSQQAAARDQHEQPSAASDGAAEHATTSSQDGEEAPPAAEPPTDAEVEEEQPLAATNDPVVSAATPSHEDEPNPSGEEAQVEADVAGPDEAGGEPDEGERRD